MSNKMSLKSIFLWAMIGLFTIGGVLGSLFFLLGSFGQLQLRILGTVFSLAIFSLLAMISAGNMSKKSIEGILGVFGIGASIAAAVLVQPIIWDFWDSTELQFKPVAIASVVSFAVAHAVLVLGEAKSSLLRVIMWTTLGLIATVSILLITAILNRNFLSSDIIVKLIGFFGVLDVAGTVITFLMRKLSK